MLIQAVAGLISLFALLVGLAVGSAFLGYAYLAALLATYCTVAICIALYVSSLKPTQSLLQADLRRLANVVKLDEFLRKDYSAQNVVSYYAHTTFRDYQLLAAATGSSAMHSRLMPSRRLPYSCGHLRQVLYVIAQMGDAVRGGRVLEVGFGKGTNTIYLADLFPSASFTAIDIVDEHVQHASAWAASLGLKNARFVRDDASMPTVPGPFDVMFGIEAFCHVDTDDGLKGFLAFASKQLKPGGRLVVVDGFRGERFEELPEDVRQAMMLAESGFRIRRMASKGTWQRLAAEAGLEVVEDADMTGEALGFWTQGWRVAHCLLLAVPWALRAYIARGAKHAETGANLVSVAMTAYAMALGSAEYGVLVLKKGQ